MDYTYWVTWTRVLMTTVHVLLYTDLFSVTSNTLFFWSEFTGPASTHWLMALMMMWRFDLELGFTNNLGPKQKTSMKISHMNIILRVLSIKSALPDLPVLLLLSIAGCPSPASKCGNTFLPFLFLKLWFVLLHSNS